MQKFVFPKIGTSMLLAVMVVGVLFFINDQNFTKSTAATAQIEDYTQTLTGLNKLQAQLIDAETGQRGYLLTGDERYLQPYSGATLEVNNSLDAIHKLVNKTPEHAMVYDLMARNISRKLAELELTVKMRKDGKEDAWKYVVATNVGKQQMDAIREHIIQLSDICEQKVIKAQNQIQSTLLISRIGIALLAMTGLLAFYLYLRQNTLLVDTSLREKESLKRERDQIDSLVKERTDNLAKLATHLQNMREDERGDLARALHDEFGSLLTAAKLDVARLKSQLSSSVPDADVRVAHLNSTLNKIILMTRNIVEDLRPSSLSHLGLSTSLEILAREFEKQHKVTIATDLENVEIGGNSQLTIYRLVQESLTNISKYAKAKNVMLSLHNLDGYISVQVRDDGIGFDKTEVDGKHHGLIGMEHRVEALGGKLVITSMPGYGTHILATIPKINISNQQSAISNQQSVDLNLESSLDDSDI
jgi:signal transduction histidine kinase